MSFEFVKKIPNGIYIPKIVPLVYDDTLSYYEFVCKLLNKVNECITSLNALGVRVDDLEAAVQELQTIVSQFDDRITANENNITALQGDVTAINNTIETINGAISTINSSIETMSGDIATNTGAIASINEALSDIRDDIADIEAIASDISTIESDVDSLDGRVTTLESAAFGDLTVSPTNWNISTDMRSLSNFDYEIVNTEDTPGTDQSVYIGTGADNITFLNHGDICYLKLKNFLIKPNYGNLDTWLQAIVVSFAFEFTGSSQKFMYTKEGLTISALLSGVTCNAANDGISYLKLEESTDGMYYDLLIYPNYGSDHISYNWYDIDLLIMVPISSFATNSEVAKYLTPNTKQIVELIRKNAKTGEIEEDISNITTALTTLSSSVDTVSNDLSSYKTSNNARVGTVEGNVSSLSSSVSSLTSQVNSIKTAETWDSFTDVFDIATLPTGARIDYFHMEKVNGIVIFEVAASNLISDSNWRYGNYILGTIRSGLRSKLTPRGNIPVTFFGMCGNTFNRGEANDNWIEVEGSTDSTTHNPYMPVYNGAATATLYGNDGQNPYNPYITNKAPAYSLVVARHGTSGGAGIGTSVIIRGCYYAG